MSVRNVLSAGVAVFALGLGSTSALANDPSHGVKCPSGTTPDYNASTGVLKCTKKKLHTATPVCPDFPYVVYRIRDGRDRCYVPDGFILPPAAEGYKPVSKYVIDSADDLAVPANQWALNVDGGAGNKDRFEYRETVYVYAEKQ